MAAAGFFVLWGLNLLAYFKLKSAMRVKQPDLYKGLFDTKHSHNPMVNSSRFFKFSMRKKKWAVVDDPSVLSYLKLHRFSALVLYGYGVVAVGAFILNGAV